MLTTRLDILGEQRKLGSIDERIQVTILLSPTSLIYIGLCYLSNQLLVITLLVQPALPGPDADIRPVVKRQHGKGNALVACFGDRSEGD